MIAAVMSDKPKNTLVMPERAAVLRERLKKLFAERQAAKKVIDRIAAGEPRESFGAFTLSFEDIEAQTAPN
jgi:hypothetical protein